MFGQSGRSRAECRAVEHDVDAAIAGPYRDLASGQRGGELELLITGQQEPRSGRQHGLPFDDVNDVAQCVLRDRCEVLPGASGVNGSVSAGTGGTTSTGVGRKIVADVAIPSDWCGRLWL